MCSTIRHTVKAEYVNLMTRRHPCMFHPFLRHFITINTRNAHARPYATHKAHQLGSTNSGHGSERETKQQWG